VNDLAALNGISNPIVDKIYILRSNGDSFYWDAVNSQWLPFGGQGAGEVNDGQNIGPTSLVNTIELFAGKSGVNLQFKRLGVDDTTNSKMILQMAETSGLIVFTLDPSKILLTDLGDVSASSPANGQILRWNGTEWVPSNETAAPGGGEANDGANLGTGSQVYIGKSGATLQFRSLKGDNTQNGYIQVRVRTVGNEILFDVPYSAIDILQLPGIDGGNAADGQMIVWNAAQSKFVFQAYSPGQTNTASNLGTGASIFKQKTGVNFEFRKLKSANDLEISLSENANEVEMAAGNLLFRKNFGIGEIDQDINIDIAILDDASQYENAISAGLISCLTSTANITVTIDIAAVDAIPLGWNVEFFNKGTGRVIFAAGADCEILAVGLNLVTQNTSAHMVYIGLNTNTNKHEFALRGALTV
jgi:hypothetical protein